MTDPFAGEIKNRFDEIKAELEKIPGVALSLNTGVKCRRCSPQGPEVSNLFVAECSYLLNHDGPYSWERSAA